MLGKEDGVDHEITLALEESLPHAEILKEEEGVVKNRIIDVRDATE